MDSVVGGYAWNDVVAALLKIWLRYLMHVYLRNNRAKFHADPVWKDGTLGDFEKVPQQEQQQAQDE